MLTSSHQERAICSDRPVPPGNVVRIGQPEWPGDGLPGRGVTFGTFVRIVVAGLIGIVVFVVSSVILLLAGAFTFRMLLGVSTYRSSGTYIGVWVLGIAGGLALSMASAWQFLRSGDR